VSRRRVRLTCFIKISLILGATIPKKVTSLTWSRGLGSTTSLIISFESTSSSQVEFDEQPIILYFGIDWRY
jgi:hypothetical protein